MRDPKLIQAYRALDLECAMFSNKLKNARALNETGVSEAETTLLIPDISIKGSLEKEIKELTEKVNSLEYSVIYLSLYVIVVVYTAPHR